MIAERVWKTKFGNVHQSSFSIPGMRGRGKRKQLRPASSPNDGTAPSETTQPKSPSSTAHPPASTGMSGSDGLRAYACVCVCERGRECISECVMERERVGEGGGRRGGTDRQRGKRWVRDRGAQAAAGRARRWREYESASERNDSFHARDRAL